MKAFAYSQATDAADAVTRAQSLGTNAVFVAGGTTMFDLMKLNVIRPDALIDVTRIGDFDRIDTSGDELVFGAGARMADAASDPLIREEYPALAESLDLAASQQLRNMATVGGNLLQRTRCPYYRGGEPYACNKRTPGSGCAARSGNDRANAVLGVSDQCIATYPGDWAVALAAFDAVVDVLTPDGARSIPLLQLHREPGDHPEIETTLPAGALVTAIRVPKTPAGRSSCYLKIRDRASYAFALASAAVAVQLDESGRVTDIRIAIGGAATRPWRCREAEDMLRGSRLEDNVLRAAADRCYSGARVGSDNAFKVELGTRTVVDAVRNAAGRRNR